MSTTNRSFRYKVFLIKLFPDELEQWNCTKISFTPNMVCAWTTWLSKLVSKLLFFETTGNLSTNWFCKHQLKLSVNKNKNHLAIYKNNFQCKRLKGWGMRTCPVVFFFPSYIFHAKFGPKLATCLPTSKSLVKGFPMRDPTAPTALTVAETAVTVAFFAALLIRSKTAAEYVVTLFRSMFKWRNSWIIS